MKKFIIPALSILLILGACDDSGENKTVLSVWLTDTPAEYEEVLIDVKALQVHYSTGNDDGEWIQINDVNTGIYNLLDFTNGMDTLLAEINMPTGHISQMRLILGDNNSLKNDGVYYSLQTPSAQQSGLKFNIHADLIENITYKIWIDFDAGRSVVKKGNDEYILKPVIRTYTKATSGAIKGVIEPAESKPYISVISESFDTLGTYADTTTGNFLFKGLDAGEYKVEFEPVTGYLNYVIEDVEVITGLVTDLGIVTIEAE